LVATLLELKDLLGAFLDPYGKALVKLGLCNSGNSSKVGLRRRPILDPVQVLKFEAATSSIPGAVGFNWKLSQILLVRNR
jgi:hypothetical protein